LLNCYRRLRVTYPPRTSPTTFLSLSRRLFVLCALVVCLFDCSLLSSLQQTGQKGSRSLLTQGSYRCQLPFSRSPMKQETVRLLWFLLRCNLSFFEVWLTPSNRLSSVPAGDRSAASPSASTMVAILTFLQVERRKRQSIECTGWTFLLILCKSVYYLSSKN
jgi:hypothetical protein